MVAHKKIVISYPDHLLDPDRWVNFIELHGFRDDWKKLGLTDEDLWVAQGLIGSNPRGSPVIRGTGGLRKLRFAPPKQSGRRKWYRLCYVYFPEAAVVLLIVAYAKNESDDIAEEDKKYFKELIERENAVLSKRAVK